MKNFQVSHSFHSNRVTYEFFPRENGEMTKLSVGFNEGGICYATYKNTPKCFYLSLQKMTVSLSASNMRCQQYSPMSDDCQRVKIMDVTRYNAKKLAQVTELFDPIAEQLADLWMTDRTKCVELIRERTEMLLENA